MGTARRRGAEVTTIPQGFIVVKARPTGLTYYAGYAPSLVAPRWSDDFADAVTFRTKREAEAIVRTHGGVVREVDV
jgi:hypothetical protein